MAHDEARQPFRRSKMDWEAKGQHLEIWAATGGTQEFREERSVNYSAVALVVTRRGKQATQGERVKRGVTQEKSEIVKC